jgi:hypothetical protein
LADLIVSNRFSAEIDSEMAKFALSEDDYLLIIRDFFDHASDFSLDFYRRFHILYPLYFSKFLYNKKNLRYIESSFWNSAIDPWESTQQVLKEKVIELRDSHIWRWSKNELIQVLQYLYGFNEEIAHKFLDCLHQKVQFDDAGVQWLTELHRLFNHNLTNEVIKIHASRGSKEQRFAFISTILSQIPPPPLDRIYNYSHVFEDEINQFFSESKNANILTAIEKIHPGDQLSGINNDLASKWRVMQTHAWSGTYRELIELIQNVFNLKFDVAKKLFDKALGGIIKYQDANLNIVAKTEAELKLQQFGKNIQKTFTDLQKNIHETKDILEKRVNETIQKAKKKTFTKKTEKSK